MGSVLLAKCPCGYEEDGLLLGCTMSSVEWLSSMPALCEDCRIVTAVNLQDPKARCPQCAGEVVPCSDPNLKHPDDRDGPPSVFESDLDESHRYRCPRCGEAAMLFSTYMNVD